MKTHHALRSFASRRHAVVLLIVLGMLSLFSILIVTYVVFSSQARQTAFGNSLRRDREVDYEPIHDSILKQVVAGGGIKSAAFGQDLLGDLYGVDQIRSRVAHARSGGGPGDIQHRAMLLRPSNASFQDTTLFKIPLHLASWNNNGTGALAARLTNEVVLGLTAAEFAIVPPTLPSFKEILASRSLPDYRLNDVYTGRLVTFAEGPLSGNTFRVVRYFGTVPPTGSNADAKLAGNIIIDLNEAKSQIVTFDGAKWNLINLARQNPNALTYGFGADDQPGFAASAVDFPGEFDSDDVGYSLTINGAAFNGLGENALATNDFERNRLTRGSPAFVVDSQFGPELLPNRRITGPTQQLGQQDEMYDAADVENWMLAWQPSDHRAILPTVAGLLATQTGMSLPDASKATPNIVPSFHRPEVINYLMHKPIWYDDNSNNNVDPGEAKTFANLTSSGTNDTLRLQILIKRLRAATYRPLNFDHLFVNAASSDLDADGNSLDGNPDFSGGHPMPLLNSPIEVNASSAFATVKSQTQQLATWLINGPWDVDNDGDGLPDSLWVDFDLPTQVVGNGTVVRPMVAALIEDLDGRINLNVAGNYSHITSARFQANNPSGANTFNDYFGADLALQTFGRGGGIGPAEINFSHLFDEFRTGDSAQPIFYTQTSPDGINVLRTRYGNILQSRYGGRPWDYSSPLIVNYFGISHPGLNSGSTTYPSFSDPFSRILLGARRDAHDFGVPMARPMDMFGRSTTRKQRGGNAIVDMVAAAVPIPQPSGMGVLMTEVINQPYEFEIDNPVGDDAPFTASEFHGLTTQGTGRLLSSRLVSLVGSAAETNAALSRLLTFDSRSLDSVELPGGFSLIEFMIDRFPISLRNNPSAIDSQIQRMLAVELRKGGKLNLNRPVGNGSNDLTDPSLGNVVATVTDETLETRQYDTLNPQSNPDRFAAEMAFPQLDNDTVSGNASSLFEEQSQIPASYLPIDTSSIGDELDRLTGSELLARNLYCLMYRLILNPQVDLTSFTAAEFVPNFPYPSGLQNNAELKNHYVARRLAQWAANAVDMRDTDAIMTRLRFDPNPFDANGFDLTVAASNVVWGMERPELSITESFASHDRRVMRNLDTPLDPMDPTITLDGQLPDDEDPNTSDAKDRDSDMDQFRIPEATAIVEIKSLRDPYVVPSDGGAQESFPAELYNFPVGGVPSLDLSRVVGNGAEQSPVWRLAVGYTSAGHKRSTLWTQDARRFTELASDVSLPPSMNQYANATTDISVWDEIVAPAGDIVHPVNDNSQLHLYDDNLNQTDGSTADAVMLSRFVWFTDLVPTTGLNVTGASSMTSGMRPDNVFYNPSPLVTPNLAPGGFAVVAPRLETVYGRTNQSVMADGWPYYPSGQKLEFLLGGTPSGYSLRYTGINSTRLSPNFPIDSTTDYRVTNVLPIIAVSRPPQDVDTTGSTVATGWSTYFGAVGSSQQVNIGFNISAPLSGASYYDAPTYRINDTASTGTANTYYPLVDGYRDYVAMTGVHADIPFDERMGKPLKDNNWVGVGTYQDIASLFLQRLADPTIPWDATHNPYITVDSMAMDLTVFNGDGDLRELVDPDRTGPAAPIPVDNANTPIYPTSLAFDTRRKIPDAVRDRPQSNLMLNSVSATPTDFASYSQYVYSQRSLLMTRQNALRYATETAATGVFNPYFRHQMMSAWDNGAAASNSTDSLHSGFRYKTNTSTPPAVDENAKRFDASTDTYPQSLGFVNREFGEPAQAGTPHAGASSSYTGGYVGFPIAVALQMPTWFDRPFQSIYDLMIVPATSNSRFAREYDSGTRFELATVYHETPTRFGHLLGFEVAIGDVQPGEVVDTTATPGTVENAKTTTGFDKLTGKRAGFEQVFDFVDIGALSFGQKKWFDPVQVRRLASTTGDQDQMFNRSMQLLQAPFNYTDRHRTTGKINLNTVPDYIRQGGAFQTTFTSDPQQQRPFTVGTNPQNLTDTTGMSGIASSPNNNLAGLSADPFNTAVLYGNGSVYRALASGISTFYELDDAQGELSTLGTYNGYKQSVDSRFGIGFKGFIQSRRGYGTTLFNPTETVSAVHFLNPDLDYRYPTRFAGIFAPSGASTLPSVQRHMRSAMQSLSAASTDVTLRRTHDMSMIRPDRDFDVRLMDTTTRTAATTTTTSDFALAVESSPTTSFSPAFPTLEFVRNAANQPDTTSTASVAGLLMKVVNVGVFERPQAELHKDHRLLDRDPFYRFQNPAYLSGMTTHHSNVFMLRYTVGFFIVDPVTGAVGEEYLDPNNGYSRPSGFHLIDRSIPVGYEPITGVTPRRELNAADTVIYSLTK